MSQAAVRALFRNKQLAEAWSTFVALSGAPHYTKLHPGQRPAAAGKQHGVATPVHEAPGKEGERRARLKLLRAQVEHLIKQHGGPWKPDEFPRS